ncbi:DUF3667 domain-containing protein [Croceibacterium ferulae]|uniref:DUF3667 domain-containing protein n=1 Tax=Croceibacterium ferulae TaxID=1854641 RepID=UPI000EADB99C|nr:DUF3667 domain-containing protein [Croceibacterium ferulae]
MSDSVQASSGQTIVPPAPVAPDGHTHEAACLNCGTALIGPHCHACGQEAHLHRTAGAFLHDLLHGALHFEGRTWATLPMLLRRPGQLTRRYIEGERMRFVSPMGLFLFTVFIMFAVFQIAGIGPPADLALSNETQASVTELQIRARGDRVDIARQLAEVPDDDPTRAALQDRLAELDAALNVLGRAQSNADPTEQLENIHTGWTRLDHGIEKARKNPGLALYKLQSNSYKFSWLLIPLSLPFVALLFAWRRRFGLYDHAVFVTYSLSFMSLLFVVLTILGFAGVPLTWLLLAGTVLPIWHMATQLRHAYGLSRGSALWRTVVLTFFIQVIVSLFVTVLLVLGLMG